MLMDFYLSLVVEKTISPLQFLRLFANLPLKIFRNILEYKDAYFIFKKIGLLLLFFGNCKYCKISSL